MGCSGPQCTVMLRQHFRNSVFLLEPENKEAGDLQQCHTAATEDA